MDEASVLYRDDVRVYAEDQGLIGKAYLTGRARVEDGAWTWEGSLHYASFDVHTLLDAGQLRLEFRNGAVGYAICHEVLEGGSAPAHLTGIETPPGVEDVDPEPAAGIEFG